MTMISSNSTDVCLARTFQPFLFLFWWNIHADLLLLLKATPDIPCLLMPQSTKYIPLFLLPLKKLGSRRVKFSCQCIILSDVIYPWFMNGTRITETPQLSILLLAFYRRYAATGICIQRTNLNFSSLSRRLVTGTGSSSPWTIENCAQIDNCQLKNGEWIFHSR